MGSRLAVVVAALALSGCGGSPDVQRVEALENGVGWEQRWQDADGESVPADVVTTYRGAEHCEWQSTVFLLLGWPLGIPAPNASRARMYVRDAKGKFEHHLRGRFDDDAQLGRDARDTGYRLDGRLELWISEGNRQHAVYIVDGERVERWPRAKRHIACA